MIFGKNRAASFSLPALAIIAAFCWLPAASVPMARAASLRYPLGVNLTQPWEYDRQKLFVDAVKESRRFGSVAAPDDQSAPVDANGWPTSDFGLVVFNILPHSQGSYSLSFTGSANVSVGLSTGAGLTPGLGTVSNVAYDAAANKTTALVTVASSGLDSPPEAPGEENSLTLLFTNTAGGVKNIRLIRPGYSADSQQEFTDQFLNRLKPFSVLRGMIFTGTDGSPLVNWSDRSLPTDAQQSSPRGGCYEMLIDLANQTGKDLWLNVPDQANDDFVRQLALLLKARLSGGLRVYVEYSNEVWNPDFAQFNRNYAAAQAEGNSGPNALNSSGSYGDPYGWSYRRTIRRIIQISDIFAGVYGAAAINTTILPVFAGHFIHVAGDTPNYEVDALAWAQQQFGPLSRKLYGLAGAPYFGLEGDVRNRTDLTSADVLALSDASRQSVQTQFAADERWDGTSFSGNPPSPTFHTMANFYGLRSLSYEGGADTSGEGSQASEALANKDPAMGTMVQEWLTAWYAAGNDLMNYFNLADNEYATFGLYTDIAQDAPKSLAVQSVFNTLVAAGSATIRAGQPATLTATTPAGTASLFIPADAVAPGTAVTLTLPASVPAASGSGLTAVSNSAVQVDCGGCQPSRAVTLTFSFAGASLGGADPNDLVGARFDDASGQWQALLSKVDPSARTVTATVRHFSVFQLMVSAPQSNLDSVRVVPNPFRPAQGHAAMGFFNLPPNARVRIYSSNGELVKDLSADAGGQAAWDGTNQGGAKATSGIYFAFAQGGGRSRTFKVAIQR